MASLIGAFLQVTAKNSVSRIWELVMTKFTQVPLLKSIRVQIPTIFLNILAELSASVTLAYAYNIFALKSEKEAPGYYPGTKAKLGGGYRDLRLT